jgi:two-component system sensor histidine kinase EvgS
VTHRLLRMHRSGYRLLLALALAFAWPDCPAQPAVRFTAQEQAWIAAHPVVRIAADPSLRPLEYIEDGQYKGLAAEYMAVIGKVSGLRFDVVPLPLSAVAAAIDAGTVDVLPAMSSRFSASGLRRELIVSTPYFVGGSIIITRGYDEIVFDPRKLEGKTVALKGGTMYEQILRKNYPAIKIMMVDTPDQALAAVAAGKADAAIGIDSIMLPRLYRRYHNELHVSGTIAEVPAALSIGVRKELPELASIIEKSLATLTAKETDDMVERWLARDTFGPPSWAQILRYRTFESALIAGALILLLLAAHQARRARRKAEASEQDKARFLAVMSHEIRTPMNAILSSVELLGRSKLTQQQRQLSDLATTASEALLDLLDDVLDLSKLEARRLTLVKEATDMQQLARGVIEITELPARKKNLAIALEFDLPAATELVLDPARVRQILINLTSNAVKFTERGLVRVTIALERSDASRLPDAAPPPAQAMLLLIVSDTGIGVPADKQQYLFRPFRQAHQTGIRRFGGTGLGLAICRELCELMGGTIGFSSASDVGTCVTCRIPVELVPARTAPADESAPQPSDAPALPDAVVGDGASAGDDAAAGRTPHILVVEDHPGNRMVLGQQLTQLGYRFTIVNDGRSALAQTARRRFTLMLLDCYLPDIDGYAVASEQRAREAAEAGGNHLPIIAISAAVDREHLDACIRSGMDGTLRKPLRLAALEKLLGAWCGPGRSAVAPDVSTDAENGDLTSIFLETARDDLAGLERALQCRDHEQAARLAHRMHGAALVCKWRQVAAAALSIEQELQAAAQPGKMAEAIGQLHLALDAQA